MAGQPSAAGFRQKLFGLVLREISSGTVAIRACNMQGGILDACVIEQFIGRKERCHVKAMVERSLERHHSAAAKKQIVFLAGIPNDLWVKADRGAFQRVLDDIIANAVKHSPPGATVQVHALPQKEDVLINVRDQGIGINEAGRQKLFDRFAARMAFPTGSSISSSIGMAIVKRLAEALSGSLRWRGDSDSGSTFTLRLPAAVSKSSDAPEFSDIKMLTHRLVDFQARN